MSHSTRSCCCASIGATCCAKVSASASASSGDASPLCARSCLPLESVLLRQLMVIARQTNWGPHLLLGEVPPLPHPSLLLPPHIPPPVRIVVIGTATAETDLVHVIETQRPQSLHDR